MANPTEVKKTLAKTESVSGLQGLIQKSATELGKALPDHMKPERLVRIALTCIRLNPSLSQCTPESFLGALFTAAQIGIEPVGGRAYLLPFNNKRKIGNDWKTFKEAQFVLGYKGVGELFFRHEKSIMLNWGVVKENDDFKYELGTEAFLRHLPNKGDRGKTLGYYVIAQVSGGGKPFMYMTHDECIEHGKKHSKTYIKKQWDKDKKRMVDCEPHFKEGTPWETDTDSMCLKTVLVQLAKLLPLSVEVQKALQADESSRDYRKGVGDVLDIPDTTNYINGETTEGKPETDEELQERLANESLEKEKR